MRKGKGSSRGINACLNLYFRKLAWLRYIRKLLTRFLKNITRIWRLRLELRQMLNDIKFSKKEWAELKLRCKFQTEFTCCWHKHLKCSFDEMKRKWVWHWKVSWVIAFFGFQIQWLSRQHLRRARKELVIFNFHPWRWRIPTLILLPLAKRTTSNRKHPKSAKRGSFAWICRHFNRVLIREIQSE